MPQVLKINREREREKEREFPPEPQRESWDRNWRMEKKGLPFSFHFSNRKCQNKRRWKMFQGKRGEFMVGVLDKSYISKISIYALYLDAEIETDRSI